MDKKEYSYEIGPILNNIEAEQNEMRCFKVHKQYGVTCDKSLCKNWINNECFQNCVLIAAEDGPQTLQVIGDTFGVTRMRICQIEKTVLKKIAGKSPDLEEFI